MTRKDTGHQRLHDAAHYMTRKASRDTFGHVTLLASGIKRDSIMRKRYKIMLAIWIRVWYTRHDGLGYKDGVLYAKTV